jgi:hypothetical protein
VSVVANRAGNVGTVTVTIDVSDIVAGPGTAAEKRVLGLLRAREELSRGIDAIANTDAVLDQRVTDLAAQVATVKAARPTGTF